jgi:hypothetical protein
MIMLLRCGGALHRFLAMALGAPVEAILAGDLTIGSVVAGAMALPIAPRIGWSAVPFTPRAIGIMLRPAAALPIFAASIIGGLTTLVALWRRAAVGAEARERER